MNALAWQRGARVINVVAAIVLSITFSVFSISSVAPVHAASVNVQLDQAAARKFPHLTTVLDQLLQTLSTPSWWGASWNQKVPDTGVFKIGRYTMGEIATDFVKYLTDGKLRIDFKRPTRGETKTVAADTFCYNVTNAENVAMHLHYGAGSWRSPTAPYSDYDLAITVFHELLHVWQFHHEVAPSCYIFTKETPAYFIEPLLPANLFDRTTCPDPGGTTPVACTTSPDISGHWQTNTPSDVYITQEPRSASVTGDIVYPNGGKGKVWGTIRGGPATLRGYSFLAHDYALDYGWSANGSTGTGTLAISIQPGKPETMYGQWYYGEGPSRRIGGNWLLCRVRVVVSNEYRCK